MAGKTIEQVQEEHTDEWIAMDGVEGTAIGLFKSKPCIKIFSSKKAEDLREMIPSTCCASFLENHRESSAFRRKS